MAPWVPPGLRRPQVRLCETLPISIMGESARIFMMAAVIAAGAGRVSAQPPPTQPPAGTAGQGQAGQGQAQNPPATQTAPPQVRLADAPGTVCGLPIPEPARLPPAGVATCLRRGLVSPPVHCIHADGGMQVGHVRNSAK